MSIIKGITITLLEKSYGTADAFGRPIETTTARTIDNVLVSPVSNDDSTSEYNISGIRVVYTLCIPKGDTHKWRDGEVIINGVKYSVAGDCKEYIEANLPLDWNRQVQVYRNG